MSVGNDEGRSPTPRPSLKEELFRLMVEGVRDYAVVLLDPGGHVVGWNVGAERIFGYEQAEIVGQHFSRLFTPEDIRAGRPEHELKEVAEFGVAQDDNWLVRKDGCRFYASGLTTALRDGGLLRGYSKIFRDLTERKRLEDETKRRADELAEADRRKDEFLAMLSHELRNPLAPIMNALHVLRQDQTENPVLQQARSMIERQVRQMTRLIDDLLDVTRITRGKVQLRKEQVELSVVLQRAVETAKPLIEARQHALSVTLPDEPVWVDGDPARLEQVVGNLLTNAAKYTEAGGRIWLTAAGQPDRAVVKVRDTGVGIAPELLPRIFDLFTQAERTLDRSQGGLGVGLTLVKSLVELHGGTVIAHSGGPGQGSEFTLELPVIPRPAVPPVEAAGAHEPATGLLRVLVVDDNLDTADSLALLLKLQGYEVGTANDGIKALQVASAFRPDVILLDIGLPGADGYQVALRVRQQKGLEKVVLVAMTGYGQEADRQRSHEAGFDYHLVKPADPVKVQELLALLANRPQPPAASLRQQRTRR
jgi:PAS domain S-box-containing protein